MLTEIKIRNAKPSEKPYKLFDTQGLYLYVAPSGTKSWRFDYKFRGKRKTLTLGRYPELSLKEARERRNEARKLLKEGHDPAKVRHSEESLLFREVAHRWYEFSKTSWSQKHAKTVLYRLERYILPAFGDRSINEIKKADIIDLLERIKKDGKIEVPRRIKIIIDNIFQFANELDLIDSVPSLKKLTRFISTAPRRHYPTILDPQKVGELLRRIENYQGDVIVKSALKLLILTFVRPGELRLARWDEFNLEEGIWDIPSERTKTKRPHRVFLSRQAVEVLQKLKSLNLSSEYVFAGRSLKKPISNTATNKALRVMGYDTRTEITSHGFRAMARTLIHEKLGYPPEVIEHQLAHKVPDPLGEAYNRTKFYEQRKKMMQDWADYLDSLLQQAK